MPKIHLRQPGFTYSAFGLFTAIKEKIQKSKEIEDSRYTASRFKNKIPGKSDNTWSRTKLC